MWTVNLKSTSLDEINPDIINVKFEYVNGDIIEEVTERISDPFSWKTIAKNGLDYRNNIILHNEAFNALLETPELGEIIF